MNQTGYFTKTKLKARSIAIRMSQLTTPICIDGLYQPI
ncbi:hypothetical protein JCM19235_4274 [Vibrio maritimus]|uniref:Uncharacterized protein n=1 Tax=Vibrio maritimus TaxID=990268 RepID=A0A090S0S0_9VIBR|nr:hypothetical protein JCM19235_4274 [Vibrio maritimus]